MDIEELEKATEAAWDAFNIAATECNRLRHIWCNLHLQVEKYKLEQRMLAEIEAEKEGGSHD